LLAVIFLRAHNVAEWYKGDECAKQYKPEIEILCIVTCLVEKLSPPSDQVVDLVLSTSQEIFDSVYKHADFWGRFSHLVEIINGGGESNSEEQNCQLPTEASQLSE
jgi:hypothetical protein